MNDKKSLKYFSSWFLVLAGLALAAAPASAELVAKLPQVMNPFYLTIVDGRMYIAESGTTVHVFLLGKNGASFVKTFGREGQGPGELDFIHVVRVRDGGLDIPASNKLARFTLDGEYVDEVKFPVPVFKGGIARLGGHYLVRDYEIRAGTSLTVRLYDGNFKLIKELAGWKDSQGFEKINLVSDYLSFRVVGDQAMIAASGKETTVTVIDANGQIARKIPLALEPIQITAALKAAIIKPVKDGWGTEPGWAEYEQRFFFPDQTPGLDHFDAVDGRFVARTYRYKDDAVEFVFFDQAGKELKRMFLPFTGRLSQGIHFCFYQGRYYYLKENIDEEAYELHSIKVW